MRISTHWQRSFPRERRVPRPDVEQHIQVRKAPRPHVRPRAHCVRNRRPKRLAEEGVVGKAFARPEPGRAGLREPHVGAGGDQERLRPQRESEGPIKHEPVCKASALTARKNSGVPTSQPCTISGVPARLSFRSHMIWFSQQRFAVACSPSIVHVELSGALLAATICVRTAVTDAATNCCALTRDQPLSDRAPPSSPRRRAVAPPA